MGNQLIASYGATRLHRLAQLVKTVGRATPGLPLRHTVFVSRTLLAVIVIGVVGYFFDQMVRPLKLRRNEAIRKTRASSRCHVTESCGG